MEWVCSRNLIIPSMILFPTINYLANPYPPRRIKSYFPLLIRSKKSNYQDFQEYAKPSKLLPAMEVKVDDSFIPQTSASLLYKIKLQTSNTYGSGLTDINSGVLVCLIDDNGSSILQRLPATSSVRRTDNNDEFINDKLHFQRGCVDHFTFGAPQLGKILAVWISLESGQWRLGGIGLTVIHHCQPSSAENSQENKQQLGLEYNFEVDDILLGEKSETSMVELRPYSIKQFSGNDLFSEKLLNTSSLGSYAISNEESMKEYTDLKFSLLFYDAMLILAGSSISSLTTGENALYAFLTGGTCGFLYLLLLQRSIDELPAPELIPTDGKGSLGQIFGRFKGPVSSLVLAFAIAIVTWKLASGEGAVKLTAKDLIFGMMGFFMCKVSVMLAAFKPLPLSLRDKK